jgi:predicted TIM-barrel fold metal-dependent hydrolase
MRTITLEEHFVTEDFLKATGAYGEHVPAGMQAMREKLLDLGLEPGSPRLAGMDEGGVDLQVLSLAASGIDAMAPAEQTAMLRGVNDESAAAVRAHPERFAAFATVGLKQPTEAAKELERCVTKLGAKGLMVDGTTDWHGEPKFLDAMEFLPVLEAAAALGVPVYVHPAPPPEAVRKAYYSGLPGDAGYLLSIAGWGWHSETAIQLLRMVMAGVFDRLPTLQVIVGHMGEMLPMALVRTNGVLSQANKDLKRSVIETLKDQVHITTSGYFSRPPFDCCRAVLGMERMMYSVDYPFSPNTRGRDFLASLELSEAEMDAFRGGNAAKVLRIVD